MDTQFNLSANSQRRIHEHVERMIDHALGRVFDRYHTEIGGAGFDLAEYVGYAAQWQRGHRVAEMLECRGLSEGAFRTEEGNLHRLFQSQARRHDFAKQPRHLLG